MEESNNFHIESLEKGIPVPVIKKNILGLSDIYLLHGAESFLRS
jgi:hypothetical protein